MSSAHAIHIEELSSHPALTESMFPHPEEWNFEEGERVTVCSSQKDALLVGMQAAGHCISTNEFELGPGGLPSHLSQLRCVCVIANRNFQPSGISRTFPEIPEGWNFLFAITHTLSHVRG